MLRVRLQRTQGERNRLSLILIAPGDAKGGSTQGGSEVKVFAVNSEWHVPPHAIEIVARSAKLHIAQDVFDLARHFLCGYNHKTFLLS